MKSTVKKIVIGSVAALILSGSLVGCANEEAAEPAPVEETATPPEQKTEPEQKEAVLNLLDDIEKSNEIFKTSTDAVILKQELESDLGEGESLKDIIIDGKHITLKVNLANNYEIGTPEDLAKNRYASLTDDLLLNEYWETITVDFIGVGNISMDTENFVDEGNGRFFKAVDIEKNFKKH